MQTILPTDQGEPVIDVQSIPPYQRHPVIFQAAQELAPGEGLVLVNDHDPRPLRSQLDTLFPSSFTWQYLEQGPDTWRVRIGRPAQGAAHIATHRVRIERSGRVVVADAQDVLGRTSDGALVCEVIDCPPNATLDDVLDLMHGVVPPVGVVSIPYERLVSRRNGSCCGGMCG
jgi:Uncharacterized conserved protein